MPTKPRATGRITRIGRIGETSPIRPPEASRRRLRPIRTVAALVTLAGVVLAARQVFPIVQHRVRLHLAGRLIAAGRFEEAEATLGLDLAARPAEHASRLLLARIARRRGQITSAEEILQRAIELGLPVEEARREHALIQVAETSTD